MSNEYTRELATARLQELAPGIAKALGYVIMDRGEIGRENPGYVEMQDPANPMHSIGLHAGFPYGKVEISPRFKEHDAKGKQVFYLPYNVKRPEISVTLAKTADKIAADISRRLLPACIPLWTMNREAIDRHAVHCAAVSKGVKRLSEVVGAPLPSAGEYGHRRVDRIDLYHSKALPEYSGDVTVFGDDNVQIDFRVSMDEAETILRMLVKMRG